MSASAQLAAWLGHRHGPDGEAALNEAVAGAANELGILPEEVTRRALAGDEWVQAALLERATIAETYFFRHPEHFAVLERLAARASLHGRPYRTAWSVGCATGEEAYSIALSLAPHAGGSLRVVGSDVSPRALARARAGRYTAWSLRGRAPPVGLLRVETGWEVSAELRSRVTFARLNLARDRVSPPAPLPPQVDVIFCRNVLVYFAPERTAAVVAALGEALADDGLLVLGAMDAPHGVPGLVAVPDAPPGLFTRREVVRMAPAPPERAPVRNAARPGTAQARARALADSGDLDGALAACASSADDPASLLLAATIHQDRGELDRAELLLRRLLLAEPGHAGGHLRLMLVAARRGANELMERERAHLQAMLASRPDEEPSGCEDLTVGHVREILASLSRSPGG